MTFDTAMGRYYELVHSYIYGRSGMDRVYADECCNYVFFLYSIKGEKLKEDIVYPWLIKTAENKLKEYFRQKKKDSVVLSLEEIPFVPSDKTELSDRMITDEDIEEAKNVLLSRLSEDERRIYESYFVHKMTFVEMADHLGIDRNTASKRVHNIRKKLEEEASKMFMIGGAYTVLRIVSALFDR